jgi:dipeptidyl aminopeptidase/acylaminoacyl peptidase
MTIHRAALAAVLAVAASAANAQSLPPVEAFGRLPFITDVQISPDGKHFAGIQEMNGQPVATIYTLNSAVPPQIFGAQQGSIVAGITWAKNDRLIVYYKAAQRTFAGDYGLSTWYRTISVDVGGEKWTELMSNVHSLNSNLSTGAIVDKNLGDPDKILMPLWALSAGSTWHLALFNVDVHSGEATQIQEGTSRGRYWIADGAGGVVGRVDLSYEPLTDHLWLYHDSNWKSVRDFDASEDRGANVYGLAYDQKSLAVSAVNAAGRDDIERLDRVSGASGGILFDDPSYDVADALSDDWTGRVIGAAVLRDKMEYFYFESERAALQKAIERLFPDQDAHALSLTQTGDKAIVAVQSPDQPRTYYLYDIAAHTTTKLASEYPELRPRDLGPMTAYPYKARDGLGIPAYLTLPPGRAPKNLPLVVLPHGGPDARDAIGFDWWAQFLASRGYAVLQPNYRGSKGYGHAFDAAGFHQWGLKMQDDISDGVKKAVADGIADPKRVCIVGASYGGYAALAGATFSPELYACAVSIAGISDLAEMMHRVRVTSGGAKSRNMSFWVSRIGSRDEDEARLEATSPALHADRVRAPILLMHGKLDTTVAYSQSEEERDALRRAGKSVQFVTFTDDDHYMRLGTTRVQMLTVLEQFLRTYIGN